LGFSSQRPDKTYGQGPDILWLLGDKYAMCIEAKNEKEIKNPVYKKDYEQLLSSMEWVKNKYDNHECVGVIISTSRKMEPEVILSDNKFVVEISQIQRLAAATQELYESLCSVPMLEKELEVYCKTILDSKGLTEDKLVDTYFRG
jgi:hypothetical protein